MNLKIFKNLKFWIAILAVVLPLGILFFDLMIYVNYASGKKFSEEEIERAFLLNTPLIQKIADELESKKDFLRNPKYPLIKNIF